MKNLTYMPPCDQIVEIMGRIYGNGLTTTSGGDTNLNLTSPSTELDATAGGNIDVTSTGAIQGKADGQAITLEADGDIGAANRPFEATLPNMGDRPEATSNYGNVYIKKLPSEYTVTLDLNGGTLDGATGTVTYVFPDGTVFVLPLPTREGYRFLYWQGSIYYAGDEYVVSESHVFTAVWEEIVEPNPVRPASYREGVPWTGDLVGTAPVALIATAGIALLVAALVLRRRNEQEG